MSGPPTPPTPPPTPPGAYLAEPQPTEPGPGPQSPMRLARSTSVLLVIVFLGLLVGTIGSIVHLPYAVMSPGPASNVLGTTSRDGKTTDLIVVSGHESYPTTGSLDFTTVRIAGGPGYPVNLWSVVSAWINPDQDVYPVDAIFPPQTSAEQVQEENQAEMTDSQQEATAVALRKAGFTVPEKVTVAKVTADAPSGSTFAAGDVIVSAGGAAVTSAADLRATIQKTTPGATLDVTVQRGGQQVALKAKTGSASGKTVLGVLLKVDFQFPFSVTIDAGNVGGPSAGLMFSLGVYDKVTNGALTGGQNIAGTGTIDATGAVGPIGGIRQKVIGAKESGANYFLVPKDNCAELAGHVPDGMQAVRIGTFDDAEAAVSAIGQGQASGLPGC